MTRLSTSLLTASATLGLALALTVGLGLPAAFAEEPDAAAESGGCDRAGSAHEAKGGHGGGRRGGRPDPGAMLRENAATLGLTDTQLTTIDGILADAKPRLEALHVTARAAGEAARAEGATEEDEAAAAAARGAVRQARRATMESVRAQLSDEQWDAARELMPRREPGKGGGHGGMGRGGPGAEAE